MIKPLLRGVALGAVALPFLATAQNNLFQNGTLYPNNGKLRNGENDNLYTQPWQPTPRLYSQVQVPYINGAYVDTVQGNTPDPSGNVMIDTDRDGVPDQYINSDDNLAVPTSGVYYVRSFGGNDQDGNTTFLSGVLKTTDDVGNKSLFVEGLRQTVRQLEVGKSYTIKFHYGVVQGIHEDETIDFDVEGGLILFYNYYFLGDKNGQWKVGYTTGDTTEASIDEMTPLYTAPMISIPEDRIKPKELSQHYIQILRNIVWHPAQFTFTATAETMTFHFYPWHDTFKLEMGVRMGIDNLSLTCNNCGGGTPETCVYQPKTSNETPGTPTRFGISNIRNNTPAGEGTWPNTLSGGHIALESNTKGFVITRMTTQQIQNNIIAPQEGMMVFDTDEKCLKIYNGSQWKCYQKKDCN